MNVLINNKTLYSNLLFSDPVVYNEKITLYPVKMKDILRFRLYSESITLRKDSYFPEKKIIKMSYWEFLKYAKDNPELGIKYGYPDLYNYFINSLMLLNLACPDSDIKFRTQDNATFINDIEITSEMFDDLRRIIILQNDIDFDIDEFINKDTEEALKKAQADQSKEQDNSTIEDYIDSLCLVLNINESQVKEMTIRKFWRFIKRIRLHEEYVICKTGECSGFVTFKEPIKHWMIDINNNDKYDSLKTDESTLKNKLSEANS